MYAKEIYYAARAEKMAVRGEENGGTRQKKKRNREPSISSGRDEEDILWIRVSIVVFLFLSLSLPETAQDGQEL